MTFLVLRKVVVKGTFLILFLLLICIYVHYRYWQQQWESDLSALEQQYIHQDIQLSQDHERANRFIQQLNDVDRHLFSYYPDDDQVQIGILQALTHAGQLHNSIAFSPSPTTIMPFRLYLQDNKLYVVATLSEYKQVLYAELTAINSRPTAQIIRQLRTIIPHDHEQDLRGLIPSYILLPDILHGLQIIPNKQKVPLAFLDKQGTIIHLTVAPIPITDMSNALQVANHKPSSVSSAAKLNYSWASLDNEHTFYLDYNTCADDPAYPAARLIMDVQDSIHNLNIHKFIIDLRGNSGGDENVLLPLFDILKSSPKIRQRIIVLVDRQTASSAMFHAVTLRKELHAVIIGEPAMGDPNAPGDILPFTLPESKMVIYYCTQEFHRAPYSVLKPDIPVSYTINDMQQGMDPVLQKALHYSFQ
ncbi:S41 family peptidase [Paenibacillus dauci]|uniref:S41 family peptidase n=1 Tax=Paenibacillus dauci TaxID=1567106 RepID=UPI000619774B|nr:S41 family peptidase [Paenibacillus dauci]